MTFSSITPTSAGISWLQPLSNGTSPLHSYQIGILYALPLRPSTTLFFLKEEKVILSSPVLMMAVVVVMV
jgi:hypothetical protein